MNRTQSVLAALPHEIRRRRLKSVLTQDQLAEASNVSVARIRALEKGRDLTVQPGTIQKLARALGCEPQDISEVVTEVAS